MKNNFLRYLGPEYSLVYYNKSYKLVLLKSIFESIKDNSDLGVETISYKFREFYLNRKKKGLIPDVNADRRIAFIENSSINDITSIIKANPYNAINRKGFLSIYKRLDHTECYSLNNELLESLTNNDIKDILLLINKKITFYYSKIDKNIEPIKKQSKVRIVLSPEQKLTNRIKREFSKKKYIGDILIDDNEYNLLIELFKISFRKIKNSYTHIINDPVFATTLVQIGIRNYDNRFWEHVRVLLIPYNMNSNHQGWIGDSFYETLTKYNKPVHERGNHLANILMHGFVSNYYSNSFYDFLFAYYRIDLERDLTRNDPEMMNSLIETIIRNDNTDRTYLIKNHTQYAVENNVRGSKIRIRRFLKLIDRGFWGESISYNKSNRMSTLLSEWLDNSTEFINESSTYNTCGAMGRGQKKFSSPYLYCHLKDVELDIKFPTQIIKTEDPDSIKWRIKIDNNIIDHIAGAHKVITGYKTESKTINLDIKNTFKAITIELLEGGKRLRLFKIKDESIRFFDSDGDLIIKDKLPEGVIYSLTEYPDKPISDALIESEVINGLLRAYYELENGDIIRLPDGNPLSVGTNIEEGLLRRGKLTHGYAEHDSRQYVIYKMPPSILMKIPENRLNGTLINVNGIKHRIFDVDTTILSLKDGSGDKGYLLNLSKLGCTKDGFYNIYIDVPNDRTNRSWQFLLINGISYEFEGEPYIFQNRGSIKFNSNLLIQNIQKNIEKDPKDNLFNFEINMLDDEISFNYLLLDSKVLLKFKVPAFKWSFNNKDWFIEKPEDIWYSDFPTKIFFKYPSDTIKLYMDDLNETDQFQSVTFTKTLYKGIFECDVTKFFSWFGREKKIRTINIELSGVEYKFINIITKSYVTERIIKADYINRKLVGEFIIVGNSNYYVDIILNGDILINKEAIIDGLLVIDNPLVSGKYKIIVYEELDDDTGFGTDFIMMYEFYQDLINPYDLTGKSVQIKHLKLTNSIFKSELSEQYKIKELLLIDDEDRKIYTGLLSNGNRNAECTPIRLEFEDLNNLKSAFVSFKDEYDDYTEFLYDDFKKKIVTIEDQGLTSSLRYRRYSVIYDDEYIFGIEFI